MTDVSKSAFQPFAITVQDVSTLPGAAATESLPVTDTQKPTLGPTTLSPTTSEPFPGQPPVYFLFPGKGVCVA